MYVSRIPGEAASPSGTSSVSSLATCLIGRSCGRLMHSAIGLGVRFAVDFGVRL
jgi:hypothetical protein